MSEKKTAGQLVDEFQRCVVGPWSRGRVAGDDAAYEAARAALLAAIVERDAVIEQCAKAAEESVVEMTAAIDECIDNAAAAIRALNDARGR